MPEPDHAYFFIGNCQMQYLCSMIGAVSDAPRYVRGSPFNVNVSLEGAPVPCVKGRTMVAPPGRSHRPAAAPSCCFRKPA